MSPLEFHFFRDGWQWGLSVGFSVGFVAAIILCWSAYKRPTAK